MDRGAWQDIVHGVARVGHDLATKPPPLKEEELKKRERTLWARISLSLSPSPHASLHPLCFGNHKEEKGREEDRLNLKPEFCFQAATKVML